MGGRRGVYRVLVGKLEGKKPLGTTRLGWEDNINHLTPNDHFSDRTAPLTFRCCIFLFIQQIYILNILNMLHTLFFFFSKCRLFHNATIFGSCIHILYTGVQKFKRKFRRQRVKMDLQEVGCGGGVMDWIELARDKDRWWALVNTVMSLRVP